MKDFDRSRFDPRQELNKNNRPQLYRWRTVIIFLILLTGVLLWAVLCQSFVKTPTSGSGGNRVGFTSGSGNVPDSGQSVDGPGGGEKDSGQGKLDQAKGSSGIGRTADLPGKADPAGGQLAVDQENAEKSAPELPDTAPHIEVIAHEVKTPAPEKKIAKTKTGGTVQGRKGFYGVKVKKNSRVLFIVDCSSSMYSSSTEIPGKNRMDVLKMELEKAIFDGRSSNYSYGGFAIVKFASAPQEFPPIKKGLCKYRNKKDMQKAKEFIGNLHPSGATNMSAAWVSAIKMIKKHRIDIVYFLTDGEPGDEFNPQILRNLMKKNRVSRRIKVNCITIGGRGQSLMKKIAEDYNGSFIFIP